MTIDPNLLRAGQQDYSWISNGVNSGVKFAQTKAHLDQQKLLLEEQMAARQQQKDQIQMQKGMSVFKDVQAAMNETGKVRQAIIAGAKQKAQMFGLPISEDFWVATQDKDYDQKIQGAMKNLQDPDEHVRGEALQTLSGGISSSTWTKLANISKDTAKQTFEAKKAADELSIKQQQLDIQKTNAGNKTDKSSRDFVNKLSVEVSKANGKYGDLANSAQQALDLLKFKTGAADLRSTEQQMKSIGQRITAQGIAINSHFGTLGDRANGMMEEFAGSGGKYGPKQRAQLMSVLETLAGDATAQHKKALQPVLEQARQSTDPKVRQALSSGQIIPLEDGKKLFPDVFSGGQAPAGTTPAAAPKAPVLPGQRSAFEQQALKQMISDGLPLSNINKAFAGRKLKAVSPKEFSGWQTHFTPAPAAQVQAVQPVEQDPVEPAVDDSGEPVEDNGEE